LEDLWEVQLDRADNNQPRAQSVRGSRLLKVQSVRDSRLPSE
jgi:hypothetical protein